MDEALQTKIYMPEGLKELMSDISREVLRAQPTNIYGFIADYLSALLVTRDNLSIASQLCDKVCDCDCRTELVSELKDIGLTDDDAEIAQNIILKYFTRKQKINEGNLLSALMRKTVIDEAMFPAVVEAIRAAYLSHQAHNYTKYETSSESDQDEVAAAASHTLNLYRQTRPTEEEYGEMSDKIQTSYRAYGVRRGSASKPHHPKKPQFRIVSLSSSFSDDVKKEMEVTTSMNNKRISTASSFSLAGSMCALPKHKPYDAHEDNSSTELDKTEKEHSHIDYTARNPHISMVTEKKNLVPGTKKRISFQNDSEEEIHRVENPDGQANSLTDSRDKLQAGNEISLESIHDFAESVEEEITIEEYDKKEDINDDDDNNGDDKSSFNYVKTMNEDVDTESDDDTNTEVDTN